MNKPMKTPIAKGKGREQKKRTNEAFQVSQTHKEKESGKI